MSDTTHREASRVLVTERRPSAMAILRGIVAVVGIVALTIGALLDWIDGTPGDRLAFEAYWDATPRAADTFLTSAAIGMISVAVAGVLGLAFVGGWVLRLAGAVGLAGVLLLFAQMGRADLAIAEATDVGLWMCLGGAALLLIAGFVSTTRTVTEPVSTERAAIEPAVAETVVTERPVTEPAGSRTEAGREHDRDLGFGRAHRAEGDEEHRPPERPEPRHEHV